MSLDVYLQGPESEQECRCDHCGHEHTYKGRETFFSSNITHNLTGMASEAGIYLACWRPHEAVDPELHVKISEQQDAGNYHGDGGAYELERNAPPVYAMQLVPLLETGLALLKSDPPRFEAFNAPNGWGLYKHFVPWVEEYLEACKEYPDAEVGTSR